MWAGFTDPPDEARPRAWWHWMDGNTVVVEVANAWMNRLIAEARQPTGEIFGPVAEVYGPQAEIRPSGLIGPVMLRAYAS